MSSPKTAPGRKSTGVSSSRALVVSVVAVLIIVALAGIVLAGRKSGESPEAAAPAASAPPVAATPVVSATSPAGSAPTSAGPDEITFVVGSDKLPPGTSEKIADIVQRAKAADKTVRITVRYATGANKARDLELAKARAGAIRHEAMADGITGNKMQTELVEMPEGSVPPRDADRAVITLR